MTPREFEVAVKGILDAAGASLDQYESSHLETIVGADGSYVFDVTARFSALGADFLVCIECKHERRKTERHDVQVLKDKMRSVGANKGMFFSTAGFQSGAVEYADAHGIALVQLTDGRSSWFTKSVSGETDPPPWVKLPKYIGWWHHDCHMSVMSSDHGEYTRQALGLAANET